MAIYTLNWNELTINNMTNFFLYGQPETPYDLQDEVFIRQPEVMNNQNAGF
jgi:hypothetical protein